MDKQQDTIPILGARAPDNLFLHRCQDQPTAGWCGSGVQTAHGTSLGVSANSHSLLGAD